MSERETAAAVLSFIFSALDATGSVVKKTVSCRYIKKGNKVLAGAINDETVCKWYIKLDMQPDTLSRVREHEPSLAQTLIETLNKILDTADTSTDNGNSKQSEQVPRQLPEATKQDPIRHGKAQGTGNAH